MIKLTQQEEEAMQAIWLAGGGFIRDFHDALPEPKPPYTTLASTVKNLEKKGFIKPQKVGVMNKYLPAVKEEDYKKRFIKSFVQDYFQNSYKDLVAFFAKQEKISSSDLKEIINMIEHKKES